MIALENINHLLSYPTPFYVYDMELLEQTLQAAVLKANEYGFHIHYALKANSNIPILNTMRKYDLGADCVSGNEILRALECGFPSNQIVFAGVGKSDQEIRLALENGIFCLNCESSAELLVINELASEMNTIAPVALRINPNINANTHHYITTGLEENKFGINRWELNGIIEQLQQLSNVQLTGLHFHIGSQITDLSVYRGLCLRVNEIKQMFENQNIHLDHINVGGGLGIDYAHPEIHSIPDFSIFFDLFHELIDLQPHQSLHFELGRSLVGQCGTLISKVLFIKEGIEKKFAIIDAGMTDLLRPALYQASHKIDNLSNPNGKKERYDVVGPICESSDSFGKAILLPKTSRGDFLALRSAGAYGEVMSFRYNLRDLPESYYFRDKPSTETEENRH